MDAELTRAKKLYRVVATRHYTDGHGHYPKTKSKTYPSARYVKEFMKGEAKAAQASREPPKPTRWGYTNRNGHPYHVTFTVFETPLVWEDKTEDWEDELILFALGGE